MSSRIKLYVDGQQVELISEPSVILSYDAASTRSIEAAREDSVVEFDVEMSHSAALVFGGEGYLHSAARFNSESHIGEITYEGISILKGELTLRSVERSGETSKYGIRVSRAAAEWADYAAETLISLSEIDYQITLRQNDLEATWEEEQPVQFFPVTRDEYDSTMSSVSLETVRRIRSIDEYHPFLKIDSMLNSFVEKTGYELVSEIALSEEFQQLFMSGSYVSQENDAAEEAMDFYVKKLSDESTTADYSGRVSFSISQSSNAIDYFVDIDSIDEDNECYSRGNCLEYSSGAVQFTPPTEISVGFEYRVLYTTEYWIESRTKLKGFDTFFFGESPTVAVDIVNNFADEREEELLTGSTYLVMIFDHTDGASYRLRAKLNGSSSYTTLTSWTARTLSYTTPFVTSIEDMIVEIVEGSSYVSYSGDWALYQGYIEEWGETEIDVTIRTSPSSVSKTSPKRFEAMYVEGAEAGMSFTLKAGTSITPYFSAYPGYGDVVEYVDVAQHELYQSDVLESVQHMFNLRYYSDPVARRLYLDPLDRIYDTATIWDWSDKILLGEAITYEDAAIGVARVRKWGYLDGDGAVSRSSPDFGEWSYTTASYATNDTSVTKLNPIFSPTLNDDDGLPIVGDRDDISITDTLEFSPRVLYYRGLDDNGDPVVVFHSDAEGVSLCFEDRDSLTGLNKYYAKQIECEERGQYVTLTVALEPHEMADLLSPLSGRASVLSTFGLRIDGEWTECWIEQIVEYRVGEGCAKIKFLIVK